MSFDSPGRMDKLLLHPAPCLFGMAPELKMIFIFLKGCKFYF